MLLKKDSKKGLDIKKLNELISLLHKISKVAYVLLIIGCAYALVVTLKETKIISVGLKIISIMVPLFIGIFIAWLFDPLLRWLNKKGMSRTFATIFVYFVLIALIYFIMAGIIPLLASQLSDFVQMIPSVIESVKNGFNGVFSSLSHVDYVDVDTIKNGLFNSVESLADDITKDLPATLFNIMQSLISGIGVFLIGLVIGFFLLINFDNTSNIVTFLPKKLQENTQSLITKINGSLRSYINGALLDSTFVFIVSSIGLSIVGLKAPILFGLFCGLTNIIPYAGPYIGGIPAIIVGFSQGPAVGIFTLIVIVIIQIIEGNFIQPVIMSKTTKLHPVTIIIGLLVFGYFFGIIGMLISTPLIAVVKAIFVFYNEKYKLIQRTKEIDEEEE